MIALAPQVLFDWLWPHVASVGLCAARLLPVVFLCPLLGGPVAPGVVRLGVVLALSLFVHVGGGVDASEALSEPSQALWPLACELVFGVALGLVAAAPYDAAKVGGRVIDLVRGTSAEAALPQAGTRESATGELLGNWLLAMAATGVGLSLTLRALLSTFLLWPPGGVRFGEHWAEQVAAVVVGAMSAGLAIGAPVAACCLAADGLVGLASRLGAGSALHELSAPLRILGGGLVLWLGLGVIATKLLESLTAVSSGLAAMAVTP